MAGMTTKTSVNPARIFDALDKCTNLFLQPIGADQRARIFAAVDEPSLETWDAAKHVLITPKTTLWQAVITSGLSSKAVPTGAQIVRAIALEAPAD